MKTKTWVRPLLMVAFVFLMVFLMQQKIAEDETLKEQQEEIDPNSVIYYDIGLTEYKEIIEDGSKKSKGALEDEESIPADR